MKKSIKFTHCLVIVVTLLISFVQFSDIARADDDASCTGTGETCETPSECSKSGGELISGKQCSKAGQACCKHGSTPPPNEGEGDCSSGLVPCGRNCDNPDTTNVDETKPCTLCHLIIGIQVLWNYAFKIMIAVALLMITIGGVLYIVSAGKEGLMTLAKDIIIKTLTGFAIILAAWLIVNTILYYIGASDKDGNLKGTNATWGSYSCDTQSSADDTDPPGPPSSTNCCIVEPGKCSHVADNSQCTTGTYKNQACSEIKDCTGSFYGESCGTSGRCWSESACPTGYKNSIDFGLCLQDLTSACCVKE